MDIARKLQEKGATVVAHKSKKMDNGPLEETIEIIYDGITWIIKASRNDNGTGTFRVLYAYSEKQIAEVYSVEDLVDLFN